MARLIPLTDPQDPRIEPYHGIRERDLVGRDGRFIVEGRTVLDVALSARSRFPLDSLLLAESRVEALTGLLAQAPEELPVYTASQPVLDGITGFHIHRGLLGMGRRGAQPSMAELIAALPEEALVVVPLGITNHDNVGGIMRNAAAFGADAALFDFASCDPLYRKAIRVSVGGSLMVPFAREGSAEAVCDLLAQHGFTLLALSPAGAAEISQLPRPPRTALLLGAEGPGLPAHILDRATTVRIDMAGNFDSLNVSTASGIALHAMRRMQITPA